MSRVYSEDLREWALKLIDEGKKAGEVGNLLGIGRSSLYLWLKRRREEGHVRARKDWRKGYGHKIPDLEGFKEFARAHEGLTAKQLAEVWGNITAKTICKWLHRIGFTRKKRLMGIKSGMKRKGVFIWKL